MSKAAQTWAKEPTIPKPTTLPVQSKLLQRKCACGDKPGVDGVCEECRAKRLDIQRSAMNQGTSPVVPPLVYSVLRSPGQQLDSGTRAFMEPRFGHDFSQVRIHFGAEAAESARLVNAQAYTVGRNVVFGAGQYELQTDEGKNLLAHELTHVVQNAQINEKSIYQQELGVSHPKDPIEQEADARAYQIMHGGFRKIKLVDRMGIARSEKNTKTSFSTPSSSSNDWNYDPQGLLNDPHVNPQFKALVQKALTAAVAGGLRPKIHQVYRSPKESAEKYEAYKSHKGARAAPAWESAHNYGLGMDVYLYDTDGGLIDTDNKKKHPDWYKQVKKFAYTYMSNFVWGEPIGDTDHFEYHPNWAGLITGKKLLSTLDWAQKASNGQTDYTQWINYFWWKVGAGGQKPAPQTTTKP